MHLKQAGLWEKSLCNAFIDLMVVLILQILTETFVHSTERIRALFLLATEEQPLSRKLSADSVAFWSAASANPKNTLSEMF